jgi:two-component system chemotaxis sensor kinase CheA
LEPLALQGPIAPQGRPPPREAIPLPSPFVPFIKAPIGGIDRLIRACGELAVQVWHFEERFSAVAMDSDEKLLPLGGDLRQIGTLLKRVGDEARALRMIPFADICAGFERLVADLARAEGKRVTFRITGGDVLIDTVVGDALRDPLRHLLRNAVDHGVEEPNARRESGKKDAALIELAARLRGDGVEIEVRDDGRGIDLEALRHKTSVPEGTPEEELLRMLFLPGISTARNVSDISGRGIGLDAVKSRVEAFHGTVDVSFVPAKGTSFRLLFPLALTQRRALLVGCSGQVFAIADSAVVRVMKLSAGMTSLRAGIGGVQTEEGDFLPLASLAELLGRPDPEGTDVSPPLLHLKTPEGAVALVVASLLSVQELVVENLGPRMQGSPLVAGGALMPDGEVALFLAAPELVRRALAGGSTWKAPALVPAAPRKRILVVDDSVTSRTLIGDIVRSAGHEVEMAADGNEAWQSLLEREFHAVVCDVDMPGRNGFELLQDVRASAHLKSLPMVLVTSRATPQDRLRGMEAGADAYLLKGSFERDELLETLGQLL